MVMTIVAMMVWVIVFLVVMVVVMIFKEWSREEEGHTASPHWAETAAERKVGQGNMVEAQRRDGK